MILPSEALVTTLSPSSLAFLTHLILSCLWAFIQVFFSLSMDHPLISWVILMNPPKHYSGITSSVESSLSFLEIIYFAATYRAPLYRETWNVLGTWKWLNRSQYAVSKMRRKKILSKWQGKISDKYVQWRQENEDNGGLVFREVTSNDSNWFCSWVIVTDKDNKEWKSFWDFCGGWFKPLSGVCQACNWPLSAR